jgi:hypothetical protein
MLTATFYVTPERREAEPDLRLNADSSPPYSKPDGSQKSLCHNNYLNGYNRVLGESGKGFSGRCVARVASKRGIRNICLYARLRNLRPSHFVPDGRTQVRPWALFPH